MTNEKKKEAAALRESSATGVVLPAAGAQAVGRIDLPTVPPAPVSPDLSEERAKGLQPTFPAPRAYGERGTPRPGDILLFKIDREIDRPLLTSMVTSDGLVYGAVLFTPHDSLCEWPRLRLMVKLSRNDCWRMVEAVAQGDAVGQWRWSA